MSLTFLTLINWGKKKRWLTASSYLTRRNRGAWISSIKGKQVKKERLIGNNEWGKIKHQILSRNVLNVIKNTPSCGDL